MKNSQLLVSLVGILLVLAFSRPVSAQTLVISDGSTASPWVIGSQDFTTIGDGVATLSTSDPNYQANLSSYLSTNGLPASLSNNAASGWVFSNSMGTVVISDNP